MKFGLTSLIAATFAAAVPTPIAPLSNTSDTYFYPLVAYIPTRLDNDTFNMNLFYNYNDNEVLTIGTILCDGSLNKTSISKYAFKENVLNYDFYKYYIFNFYSSCSYNGTCINFTLDQSTDTCVGFDQYDKCIIDNTLTNIVNVTNWIPTLFTSTTTAVENTTVETTTVDTTTVETTTVDTTTVETTAVETTDNATTIENVVPIPSL